MKISIVGLGYVGLPLAVALGRHYEVIGFDVDKGRVRELGQGIDRTGEITQDVLKESSLVISSDPDAMAGSRVYIVTVPTPVDAANVPNLAAVRGACDTVGKILSREGRPAASAPPIIVFESTVYPGVTEDICGAVLAAASGLQCGTDFYLGYSPERINPGDREHTVDKIAKVVAGQSAEVVKILEEIYGHVTSGGVFVARDIRTAEAAKVIENAQRDINIAFINEVTQIFQKIGLSVSDVLEAANTKWNFLPFTPGLVGGHCIGVDPYYLAHCAQSIGHDPEVILAGRRINDAMGHFVADRIDASLEEDAADQKAPILVLGLTFKENVPDLRNSKVIDVITRLEELGHQVLVHDPQADPSEAREYYGVELLSGDTPADLSAKGPYRAIVGAVGHQMYADFGSEDLINLLIPGGLVADIKNIWGKLEFPDSVRRWKL